MAAAPTRAAGGAALPIPLFLILVLFQGFLIPRSFATSRECSLAITGEFMSKATLKAKHGKGTPTRDGAATRGNALLDDDSHTEVAMVLINNLPAQCDNDDSIVIEEVFAVATNAGSGSGGDMFDIGRRRLGPAGDDSGRDSDSDGENEGRPRRRFLSGDSENVGKKKFTRVLSSHPGSKLGVFSVHGQRSAVQPAKLPRTYWYGVASDGSALQMIRDHNGFITATMTDLRSGNVFNFSTPPWPG